VPSRTGCDLENETVVLLSQLSNIIGIKDATGELDRIGFLKDKVKNDFIFISGDDLSFVEYMERGGCGVISVTANVIPDLMHNICHSILNGDIEKSKTINNKLSSLHDAMFIDSNPMPVKWLLNYLGLIREGIRLPLVELDKKHQTNLIEAFESTK
jgi:4-hydroxy-tetrahydrodipicolinate synthase